MPVHQISRFGWRPDLPDIRDVAYKLPRLRAPVPRQVDLRDKMPPVVDQGALGSCTANAITAALDHLRMNPTRKLHPSSRLFVYYNEREMEGTIAQDAGAYLRDGMKVVATLGAPWETTWPYNVARFAKKPTKAAFASAGKKKIGSYHPLDTVDEMRECLAEGFPFVFGFTVYDSFMSLGPTGELNLPAGNERAIGGHAVLAVGYDMDTDRFIIRNSWGTDWGIGGHFTMPSAYLADRNLSADMWTVRLT